MKKKLSLSLVLILIFSFCSSDEPGDMAGKIEELEQLEKEVEKLEILCLSDEDILAIQTQNSELEINIGLKNNELNELGNSQLSEDKIAEKEAEILSFNDRLIEYEEEIRKQKAEIYSTGRIDEIKEHIEHLKLKTGISYDDIDFANFGHDGILEDLNNGIIIPLEEKSSITTEEQNELNMAKDKVNLLETTFGLFKAEQGNPNIERLENDIVEIKNHIRVIQDEIDPSTLNPEVAANLNSEIQSSSTQIKENLDLISSTPLCVQEKAASNETSIEKSEEQVVEKNYPDNIENEYLDIINGFVIRETEKIDESKYGIVENYQLEEFETKTFKAPSGYKVAKAIAWMDKPGDERCSLDISAVVTMYTIGLSEFTLTAEPVWWGHLCPGPKIIYITFGYIKKDIFIDISSEIKQKQPNFLAVGTFLDDLRTEGYYDRSTPSSPLSKKEIKNKCNDKTSFRYNFNGNLLNKMGDEATSYVFPDKENKVFKSNIPFKSGEESNQYLDLSNNQQRIIFQNYIASCLRAGGNLEISTRIKITSPLEQTTHNFNNGEPWMRRPLIASNKSTCDGRILGFCLYLQSPGSEKDFSTNEKNKFFLGLQISSWNKTGTRHAAWQTPLYVDEWHDVSLLMEFGEKVPSATVIVNGVATVFTHFPEWDLDVRVLQEFLFADDHIFSLGGVEGQYNRNLTDGDIHYLVDYITFQNIPINQNSDKINNLLNELIDSKKSGIAVNEKDIYESVLSLFENQWEPISSTVLNYLKVIEDYEGPIYPGTTSIQAVKLQDLSYSMQLAHYFKLWIFDRLYTEENIQSVASIKFLESEQFPGKVTSNAGSITRTVQVDGKYISDKGYKLSNLENVLRPTGLYVAPGTLVTLKIPKTIINEGWMARIGIQRANLSCWSGKETRRFNRISNTFDLDQEVVQIASPHGGGLYIQVPDGSNVGLVEITAENVLNLPTYSTLKIDGLNSDMKIFQEDIENSEVPWFEIISQNFNMTYPLQYAESYKDPTTMINFMNAAFQEISLMAGRPKNKVRAEWLVVDAQIPACGTAMGAGYPTYGDSSLIPSLSTKVTDNLWYSYDKVDTTYWHETGHIYHLPTIPMERESQVHLLKLVVDNKTRGINIDTALRNSGFQKYDRLDSAFDLMLTNDWLEGKRICCSPLPIGNEVQYQTKSWARVADFVDLYGWTAFGKFQNVIYEKNTRNGFQNDDNLTDDEYIFRGSHGVGINMAPLFEFWGIPVSPSIKEGLKFLPPPVEFIERLKFYKSKIPKSENEFSLLIQKLENGDSGGKFTTINWVYSPDAMKIMHERIDKIIREIEN